MVHGVQIQGAVQCCTVCGVWYSTCQSMQQGFRVDQRCAELSVWGHTLTPISAFHPWVPNIELSMWEAWNMQINSGLLNSLTLRFVDSHSKGKYKWILVSLKCEVKLTFLWGLQCQAWDPCDAFWKLPILHCFYTNMFLQNCQNASCNIAKSIMCRQIAKKDDRTSCLQCELWDWEARHIDFIQDFYWNWIRSVILSDCTVCRIVDFGVSWWCLEHVNHLMIEDMDIIISGGKDHTVHKALGMWRWDWW